MRFGIFYEHQMARPWEDGAEEKTYLDALEQVELADQIGIQHVWEVEHHFLEEYSHSSAPEVFLAAASQRTSRIRLGHGIVALPPAYNHPARVAERIAALDLVSRGRVEFGTGETSSQSELGGFGVPRSAKREQWEESLDIVTRMFVEEPFAGVEGKWVKMPPRNVVPKPLQKPHPPIWVACSRRDTILMAARKGIGALSFSFVEPEEAKQWVDEYYRIIASEECIPAGFAVNPNVAVVLPFMCHEDERTAIERGIDGAHFFGYSLAHYYVFGEHRPGRTNVWEEFQANRSRRGFARDVVAADQGPLGVKLLQRGLGSLRGAIGTPEQVRDLLARYEAAGVDQVILVSQAGHNKHDHVLESLELFGKTVLPHFADRVEEKDEAKAARLAPHVEAALARRPAPRQAPADYVISVTGEPAEAPAWRQGGTSGPQSAADLARHAGRVLVGGVLRRADPRLLEMVLGSDAALGAAFKAMAGRFRPESALGWTGDIQYLIGTSRGTRAWFIRVEGATATARKGRSADPQLTLTLPFPLFLAGARGETSFGRLMMEDSSFQAEGDLGLLGRMSEMFVPPGTY
ncbi:MAG TPA: LLM class flavin-dependent oxidoreductase [Acidimicrobiales bacterium]|nr:LLM class flavin-dependent oxidoreductase [Acidimicrobiales bacterium]